MGTTTTTSASSGQKVRRIFPPCPAEKDVGKTVKITVYDPKKLINGRSDLKNVIMDVQVFYNDLQNTPELSSDISDDLAEYTFQTTYKPSRPNEAEIKDMGRMDFPIYVFQTPGVSQASTSEKEIFQLMEAHQISSRSFVIKFIPELADPIPALTQDFYKEIKSSWKSETILGYGFPGHHYTEGTCQSLGIIKIDALLKNPRSSEANKFKLVLIHELGHMFALRHENDTIMHPKYEKLSAHFSKVQIGTIRNTLKKISP